MTWLKLATSRLVAPSPFVLKESVIPLDVATRRIIDEQNITQHTLFTQYLSTLRFVDQSQEQHMIQNTHIDFSIRYSVSTIFHCNLFHITLLIIVVQCYFNVHLFTCHFEHVLTLYIYMITCHFVRFVAHHQSFILCFPIRLPQYFTM